jgi:hypothetical protein
MRVAGGTIAGSRGMLQCSQGATTVGRTYLLLYLRVSHHDLKSNDLTLAYYAYALSRPSECLSIIGRVKDLADIQSRIPTAKSSASTISTLGGSHDQSSSSSSWTGSFASADTIVSTPYVQDGRAWSLVETLRSICIQGTNFLSSHFTELR